VSWPLVVLILGSQLVALAFAIGWRWTAVSRAEEKLEAHRIKLADIDRGTGIALTELAGKVTAIETHMKLRRVG